MERFFSSFVSASAGTGKTKTLIDRLLFLLLNGVKPNKILCLSFTKAAASEIISRINQKLSYFCSCDQTSLIRELESLGIKNIDEQHILRARMLFAEFQDSSEELIVQTIHSFCQDLLNKFPYEAGVKQGFKLLDEQEVSFLIEEAKNTLFEDDQYRDEIRDILKYLSWNIKEYSFDELLNEIIVNRERLDLFFESGISIKERKKLIDENLEIEKFISKINFDISYLKQLQEGSKSDLERVLSLDEYLNLPKELKILLVNKYFSCFLTQTGTPLKAIISKQLAQNYPDLSDYLHKEQARVYSFYKKYNQIKTTNQTNCFVILSYFIRKIYKNLKQERNLLDYDDLIISSSNLLSDSEYADWVRYRLDGGIDHILVDEAQDNSIKQWNIINKITEEFFNDENPSKSIFIVGDSKQSIFRFQGAAPEIFAAMNEYLPEEVKRVALNKSYRSARNILEFIDKLFNQSQIRSFLGNDLQEIKHATTKDFTGHIEIWPLVVDEKKQLEKSWQLPSERTEETYLASEKLLAEQIADKIAYWLAEKKFLQSRQREINPGDILILSRRRNNFLNILLKNLRQRSIPVAGLDRIKLFEHPAILDLMALSNFLLCMSDDMNLAIVLKSPIVNLSEEELMRLANNRENTLWNALVDQNQYQEICRFFESLKVDLIYQFFFNLIESNNLREVYAGYFGSEIDDIFNAFLDIVEKFENENSSSLQQFVFYAQTLKEDLKRDLSGNVNQIRIMTVHGAKGLQAPIVILADTVALPSNSDKIIWLENGDLRYSTKTQFYSEQEMDAKGKIFAEDYAEYIRLLYVALTRAEEEIIITANSKTKEISEKSWYSILSSVV